MRTMTKCLVVIRCIYLLLLGQEDIYIRWLEAQIDYANGEYGKYNNSITMYNTAYSAYEKYYNREHKPIQKNFTHF